MPHIFQHNIVHHGKVGVNKTAEVVQNDPVQQQGIPELRLGRAIIYYSIGHHVEDEVNVADSTLQCCSGSLKKLLRPMISSFPISVIMQNYRCTIWGGAGGSPLTLLPL